jgi:hypothetical protein
MCSFLFFLGLADFFVSIFGNELKQRAIFTVGWIGFLGIWLGGCFGVTGDCLY